MPPVEYLQIPQTLPQAVDPQVRNFFVQLTIQLRGWSDEIVRVLNSGPLVVPVVATDPVAPANGQVWYNTTTHTFKGCQNGAVVTFTTGP
jgi:hypothetical protein